MPTVLMAVILTIQVLLSVGAYPFLPDQVPVHWNISGQANSYAPKGVGLTLLPLISFVIFVVLRLIVKLGPRLTRDGEQNNSHFIDVTLSGVMLLMLVIQLATVALSLGVHLDMRFIISLVVSLFLIVIGNYMGKLRRNFWAGIRTPWTLTNDTVWERTHRLGGWLFVAAGLIGLISSFVPQLSVAGLLVPILGVSIICYVYSYFVYQRVTMSDSSQEE
ncbi:SdpI family protein [Ktedonospora formicarum]|nr:SdpI family protein [Ktedonospora formicarum]